MKIAVLYNRKSKKVINLFGIPSREKYGSASIQRIVAALERGGHCVQAFESDKNILANLEIFMPRALPGERPGMVLNLAYGIQGQARYTHVPGMLEMAGLPYVGSGPLGHSLALDKVVAKMLFLQNGIPTPEFAVLEDEDFEIPDLHYPLIVKPKNEAVSFGLRIVHNDEELRSAAIAILREFGQAVLVERFIDGREINVGLLGNGVPEALPVTELIFAEGPRIYTEADKKGRAGDRVSVRVPADLEPELAARAQRIAQKAFMALGLHDCARVDMRIDGAGHLWVLEINSLPSLGEHGSYTQAAAAAGLDFATLVNRLVDVAAIRYFGPHSSESPSQAEPSWLSATADRRRSAEDRIEHYIALESAPWETASLRRVAGHFGGRLQELGLRQHLDLGDRDSAWLYSTSRGYRDGTLILVQIDVPSQSFDAAPFRRDPEWLFGQGIASSRAPMVVVETALETLAARLDALQLGVLAYARGGDGHVCGELIRRLSLGAARVLVMVPASSGGRLVCARRGERRYHLRIQGEPRTMGAASETLDAMTTFVEYVRRISQLTSGESSTSVDVVGVQTTSNPHQVPHCIDASLVVTFTDEDAAGRLEIALRDRLDASWGPCTLTLRSETPPMLERAESLALVEQLGSVAGVYGLPFGYRASAIPSAAGWIPPGIPAVCGMGPVGVNLQTREEAVSRIGIAERALLLTAFLAQTCS